MIKWEQMTPKKCDESKCTSEIIHVLTALEPAEPRADLVKAMAGVSTEEDINKSSQLFI